MFSFKFSEKPSTNTSVKNFQRVVNDNNNNNDMFFYLAPRKEKNYLISISIRTLKEIENYFTENIESENH